MNNIKYELFKFEENIPLKINIYKLGEIKSHWHNNIELFYVLEGTVEIITNDQVIVLKNEDVYLSNAYDTHELQGQEAVVLSVEIDIEKLGVDETDKESLTFDCNSSFEKDKTWFFTFVSQKGML